ncbi:hypothetical protein Tco_1135730, partial [Tanacetum coccineum]
MQDAIPRVVSRVMYSEQFASALLKMESVVKGIVKDMGRKEAHSFTSQPCANDDQIISQKIEEVIDELKRTEW